jgi:hypothetical protein
MILAFKLSIRAMEVITALMLFFDVALDPCTYRKSMVSMTCLTTKE